MKKKLTYIAFARMPTEKAHGIQITSMCQAFSSEGCDVTLVVPKRKNTILQNTEEYYNVGGFDIVYVPVIDLVGRFGVIGFYLTYIIFSIQVLLRFVWWNSNIVYTRDLYTSCLLRFFGKNIYYEPHTKSVISGLLFKMFSKSVSHFFPISLGLRDILLKQGIKERRITLLPDAVNMDHFASPVSRNTARVALRLPEKKFIVTYVGKYSTMGKKKGVDQLIKAFSILLKKTNMSDSLLLVVGLSVAEVSLVRKMCLDANLLKDNFLLITHVPHKKVPMYLWASNALVMNYPHTEHYAYFMSPLKLFEYLASGIPIVSTDLPSVREVVSEKDVVFVKPGDPDSLADGLISIKNHPEVLKKNRLNYSNKVGYFDWRGRAEVVLNTVSD